MGAQRLDVFLVLDTETLLLVDDDQAQFLPSQTGLQQPVGADHDIDLTDGHPVDHLARFSRIGESRQPLHRHRESGHPLGEGLQMLLCQ